MTRVPQSGDRVPGGASAYEVVHVGIGGIVLREIGADGNPTGDPVPMVTPEGWREMVVRAAGASR